MKLIYATTNEGKFKHMRQMLSGIDIDLTLLTEYSFNFPDIAENGISPLENAEIKARAYYSSLKKPLFSCDSGLYIDGLPDALQPGIHVRTINGKYLDDDEMIKYYSGLAGSLGGKMTARYRNAICMILSENEVYSYSGADISYKAFIISDKPHLRRTRGFPIDSLSIQIASGKYYFDLGEREDQSSEIKDGFRAFFLRTLPISP